MVELTWFSPVGSPFCSGASQAVAMVTWCVVVCGCALWCAAVRRGSPWGAVVHLVLLACLVVPWCRGALLNIIVWYARIVLYYNLFYCIVLNCMV